MGNSVSLGTSQPKQGAPRGRVILWDGSVREFEPPYTAAELMLDHPNQAVAEFNTAVNGKRPATLPADATLEAAKLYVMLPMKRKASKLSGDEIRRVVAAANSIIRSPSPAATTVAFLPLFARVCVVSAAKTKKRERRETTTVREEKNVSFIGLESFVEERGDDDVYSLSRQVSGKRGNWKPSLDTIEEKVHHNSTPINNNQCYIDNKQPELKKISHWLF